MFDFDDAAVIAGVFLFAVGGGALALGWLAQRAVSIALTGHP